MATTLDYKLDLYSQHIQNRYHVFKDACKTVIIVIHLIGKHEHNYIQCHGNIFCMYTVLIHRCM